MSRRLLREQQGASSVIVALCMTAILIVVALVVDIGATAARKAQLQDAADAAALAVAQRCYDSPQTTELAGCAATVKAAAADEATSIAQATVNDGDATLRATSPIWDADLHTVTVELTSLQTSLFSWSAGAADTAVAASATAEWQQPAVALPLAMNSCVLEKSDPDEISFSGIALLNGIGDLTGPLLELARLLGGDTSLGDYLGGVLGCGTNVLAGGWITSSLSDCEYDPNLLTTLNATLNRILPIDSKCVAKLGSLLGKRIIVPVYDNATIQVLGQALGSAPINRFAEIVVTGYEFRGVLNLAGSEGPLVGHLGDTRPGCPRTLSDILGLEAGATAALQEVIDSLDELLGPLGFLLQPLLAALASITGAVVDGVVLGLLDEVVEPLTGILGLCQGVQGYVVDHDMTAEEAAAALVPYRLVA